MSETPKPFDASTYDTWRLCDFPVGYVCPEGGTSVACCTGGWRAMRPVWLPDKCTNCMICWAYCPDSSIEVKKGVMTGIDLQHCKGCGVCVKECKFGALELVKEANAQQLDAHRAQQDVMQQQLAQKHSQIPSGFPENNSQQKGAN